jgi:hypothetical protein
LLERTLARVSIYESVGKASRLERRIISGIPASVPSYKVAPPGWSSACRDASRPNPAWKLDRNSSDSKNVSKSTHPYWEKEEKFHLLLVEGGKSDSREGIICSKWELFYTRMDGWV